VLEIEVMFDARAAAIQDSSRARSTGASNFSGFDARSVMIDCKANYSKPMAEDVESFFIQTSFENLRG
jgi:hypothetical protein